MQPLVNSKFMFYKILWLEDVYGANSPLNVSLLGIKALADWSVASNEIILWEA